LLNLKNANANEQLLQELLMVILIVFVANVVIRYSSVKVTYNGFGLGEGCLMDAQISHRISMAAFAKPLLCAGRFN